MHTKIANAIGSFFLNFFFTIEHSSFSVSHTLRVLCGRQLRSPRYDKAKLQNWGWVGRDGIVKKCTLSSYISIPANANTPCFFLCLIIATCLEWLSLISDCCYNFKNSNDWDAISLQFMTELFRSLCKQANLIME